MENKMISNSDFINFIINKLSIHNHRYVVEDMNNQLARFEAGFQEVTNHDGIDFSKEIVDDIVLLTHKNKEDKVFIAASTLVASDVYIEIDAASTADLATVPGNGISVILVKPEEETEEEEKEVIEVPEKKYQIDLGKGLVVDIENEEVKKGTHYLGYKIMRRYYDTSKSTELVLFEGNKFMEVNEGMLPADTILTEKGEYLVTLTNGDMYICTEDYKIVVDVKEKMLPLITFDEETEAIEWGIYSGDLVTARIAKKENTTEFNILRDGIERSYVYSIEKDMILNKFGKNIFISGIFNKKISDYYDKSYIWVTESKLEFNPEWDERMKAGDETVALEIQEQYSNSFYNGVTPLFLSHESKMNEYEVLSKNTKDISGFIEGLDMIYLVKKSDKNPDDFTLLIIDFSKGKMQVYNIDVPYLPVAIMADDESGSITIRYKLAEGKATGLVTYFINMSDVLKYSRIVINANDRDDLNMIVTSLYPYVYAINSSVNLAEDELAGMRNIITDFEAHDDYTTSRLASTHYCNIATEEYLSHSTVSLLYSRKALLVTETNSQGLTTLVRHRKVEGSLEEYNEKVAKIWEEDLKYIKELEAKEAKESNK